MAPPTFLWLLVFFFSSLGLRRTNPRPSWGFVSAEETVEKGAWSARDREGVERMRATHGRDSGLLGDDDRVNPEDRDGRVRRELDGIRLGRKRVEDRLGDRGQRAVALALRRERIVSVPEFLGGRSGGTRGEERTSMSTPTSFPPSA